MVVCDPSPAVEEMDQFAFGDGGRLQWYLVYSKTDSDEGESAGLISGSQPFEFLAGSICVVGGRSSTPRYRPDGRRRRRADSQSGETAIPNPLATMVARHGVEMPVDMNGSPVAELG